MCKANSAVATTKPETRKSTIYRLKPPPDGDLCALVRAHYLEKEGFKARPFEREGVTGLLVTGTIVRDRAKWCSTAEELTGLSVQEGNNSSAGLLLIPTQRAIYAISYGLGHHMLDSFYLDMGFGLEFGTRCLDSGRIKLVRQQIMDARGRTEENTTTLGESIEDFGIDQFGSIFTKISGTVSKEALTHLGDGARTVTVSCSDSNIKLPMATSWAEFRNDLQVIEDVCSRQNPLPELDFIDRVHPLTKKTELVEQLNKELDALLADPSSSRLALAVPSECLDGFDSAQAFQVTKGKRVHQVDELNLNALLEFVHDRASGTRIDVLKSVQVQMFSDAECDTPASGRVVGHRWLTAEVSHGAGRYFYHQGRWYEIGAEYLESIEKELTELFNQKSSVAMPPWPKRKAGSTETYEEGAYNEDAAKQPGYILFDKKKVVTQKFKGGGLEICDLLGPDNQLICVKKADQSTAPLNHLFAQGVVAVETLRHDRIVREKFLELLAEHAPGRVASEDLGSITLVYAIRLKGGEKININSLFAFAQVSLLRAVKRLREMGARVEIVTITR
ncbi:DUF6119 family protein [Actinocorallia populi]|uniref:DUF6119 family protein n=1 Tax=Actinocorallia populi TaxID=2079200 RepID=UPI000D08C216|nr:DUF6119 family protein [Actinocorallia populi]